MDVDFTHLIWGVALVVVIRQIFNALSNSENETLPIMGRPPEMKDIDALAMGEPLFMAQGPYAVRK